MKLPPALLRLQISSPHGAWPHLWLPLFALWPLLWLLFAFASVCVVLALRLSAQTSVARVADVARRQFRVVRPFAGHVAVHLRGEHDFFAPATALREPATEDLLGFPAAVAVRGVEEVDSRVERAVHDREAVNLVRFGTEIHRAQAERAHQQS